MKTIETTPNHYVVSPRGNTNAYLVRVNGGRLMILGRLTHYEQKMTSFVYPANPSLPRVKVEPHEEFMELNGETVPTAEAVTKTFYDAIPKKNGERTK